MGNDNAPSSSDVTVGEMSSTVVGMMSFLSPAKFCLLSYLYWHTYGQGKPNDGLTFDDFENGKIVRGERCDRGCGLYGQGLELALRLLCEDGYLKDVNMPIFGVTVFYLHWDNINRE